MQMQLLSRRERGAREQELTGHCVRVLQACELAFWLLCEHQLARPRAGAASALSHARSARVTTTTQSAVIVGLLRAAAAAMVACLLSPSRSCG